jgi:integrase
VTYIEFLDRFLKWSHTDFESLLLVPQIELEEILQDYCIYLKKRVDNKEISSNSVPYFFNGIFKFLKVNRKKIEIESITQLFPEKSKLGGDLAITTEQCKILLDSTGDKRDKALIHVFCATGARPEAICELQLKNRESHLDGFFKLILYSGHSHEMVTFLHPEAAKAVTEYLDWRRSRGETLTDDSYVFRGNFLDCNEKLSSNVMGSIMNRLWKNSGIKRKKIGNNYEIATVRGFRKRFDTILEMNPEVSMGATQYLMDHAGYLSGKHYRRPTVEQLFEAYKKATPELIITSESRLKLEIKQKDTQFKENESEKEKRITELEKKLANVEILLLGLKSNGI